MTILNNLIDDFGSLKELLIKNLPSKINASNDKAGFKSATMLTVAGLNYPFISFNSPEKISLLMFDIDYKDTLTAKEHFGSIDNLLGYIMDFVGLEPSYICETNKGYQFGYHLKNWVFTKQAKPLQYLKAIKNSIIDGLGCDSVASSRNYGIFRNPLKHSFYYSSCINYELKDFRHLLTARRSSCPIASASTINIEEVQTGNRNSELFKHGMRWAKNRDNLSYADIGAYLQTLNQNFLDSPLDISEIDGIARSVFKYWQSDTIRFGTVATCENAGIMGFEKINNVTRVEYERLVKERQRLSAIRTNSLKSKQQKQEAIEKARLARSEQVRVKIEQAIYKCEEEGIKPKVALIARLAGVDRKTALKYYSQIP
jgi:hypothetical protein